MTDMSPPQSYAFELTQQNMSTALEWVETCVKQIASNDRQIFGVRVCVEELLANLLSHVKSQIVYVEINIHSDSSGIGLILTNDGPLFNPLEKEARMVDSDIETARMGGWGVPILHHFSDSFKYRSASDNNVVMLYFLESPGTSNSRV
jgi:anti-sigma regulatory factor (Ser/Thr protein kinase)